MYYLLLLLGTIVFVKVGIDVIVYLVQQVVVLRRISDLGKWVIISGATDGIGRAMALQCANRNVNLLLLGRSAEKLRDTADEIRAVEGFSATVDVFVVDFASADESAWNKLMKMVGGLDVAVLLNNVGVGYPSALYYHEINPKLVDELIDVNVRSTMKLTHAVYAGMYQRARGAIVCVGSGAASLPSEPLYAGYAGVKGCVASFCQSLAAEAASRNVLVQCHAPLLVTTKLSKIRKPSFTVPTASVYARYAINMIERGSMTFGETICSPYPIHKAITYIASRLPTTVWNRLRTPMTIALRTKYLQKIAQT